MYCCYSDVIFFVYHLSSPLEVGSKNLIFNLERGFCCELSVVGIWTVKIKKKNSHTNFNNKIK